MRHAKSALVLTLSVALAAGLGVIVSCGSGESHSTFVQDAGPTIEASPGLPFDAAPPVHDDFANPVFDNGALPNAVDVFAKADGTAGPLDGGADAGLGSGPCLYEPEVGSLFPSNWLRPRFRFSSDPSENLFQIKLVVPNQISPLVIYTTKSGYILDATLWSTLTATGTGTVHMTVRSAVVDAAGNALAGPFTGTEGDVEIAPPSIRTTGSVLYWTTSGGTVLKGFKVGDESVESIITPAAAGTQCVACHTSTPDGLYAGLTGSSNPGDGTFGSITIRSVDGKATEPPFLSATAKTLLARQQWAPAFSKGHWADGDHVMLSMLNTGTAPQSEIVWTDLETSSNVMGTGWGVLPRNGDPGPASSAIFSHDGSKVAYVSTTAAGDGIITNDGQIHVVPYANHNGGASVAVTGANDKAFNQYYPNFSADDQLIAFNRVPVAGGSPSSYNNPSAEVFFVPTSGGTATRLTANDPPACLTSKKSPGLTNSWAKFSPEVQTADGKTYYFLVFSSTRNPSANTPAGVPRPQLYVAPIVLEGGVFKTYSALMLWNQPETESNHTPAWDVFQLPGIK